VDLRDLRRLSMIGASQFRRSQFATAPTRSQRALTCCDPLCDVLSLSAVYRRAAEGHGHKWLGTCGPNLRLSDLLFFPREAAWPPDSFAERNETATLLLPAASNREHGGLISSPLPSPMCKIYG
jgi:hypothetical protein